VRDPLAFEWFAEFLIGVEGNPKVELLLFATRAPKGGAEGGVSFATTRPKMSDILSDVKSKHSGVGHIAVLACGPAIVVDEVGALSLSLSDSSVRFHFHKETFAF